MVWCVLFTLALAVAASAHRPSSGHQACNANLPLHASHDTRLLNATYYAVGTRNVSGTLNAVPFCEIYASVAYGSNDSMVFATWLPDEDFYQDRFLAVGNGGMAGVIDYVSMLSQLNSGLGLSVAGGDSGHRAVGNNDGSGAPGVYLPYLHDEAQVTAWIHDGISLFTPAAKEIINKFYHRGRPPYSYYAGCSTGGAQGFALAQFHPELFDGIYAGSPGNWYSHLALSFLWNAQATNTTSSYLTQAELNFTTRAVLDACDELDGVKDDVIEYPLQCKFDITSLACDDSRNSTSGSNVVCLSSEKITAAQAIYDGPVRADTGAQIYPGFSFGSEIEWSLQEGPLSDAFSIPILQNLVFDNLDYDSDAFDWASDVEAVDRKAGRLIDEISPDLSGFRLHGGKMLTTQGWVDPFNAATWPIEHLGQMEDFHQENVSDFYRLFMIPGGGHCGAATNYPTVPAKYQAVPALIEWVELGRAPNEILSSDPPDGSNTTRKLCSWPATAQHVAGNVGDWTSYICR